MVTSHVLISLLFIFIHFRFLSACETTCRSTEITVGHSNTLVWIIPVIDKLVACVAADSFPFSGGAEIEQANEKRSEGARALPPPPTAYFATLSQFSSRSRGLDALLHTCSVWPLTRVARQKSKGNKAIRREGVWWRGFAAMYLAYWTLSDWQPF